MAAYTNIDDPSAHFQTATYTGTGSTQSITNDGNSDLQPDLVWIKQRNGQGTDHQLVDSTRGNTKYLYSNSTGAEVTSSDRLTSFNSDGFTLGADASSVVNQSGGYLYVGWQWKANGGTTSSNTSGGITTTVQANTDAGFSIVTYTGDGATSQTVGHGLGAVPKMIISKDRGATSNVPNWRVYHEAIGNTKYLTLDGTAAAATFDDWGNTTPTSSVYTIGGSGGYRPTNTNGVNYVAYVFADVQGYSKFGKYIGNGNANGPFVYTGFKPAFVMIKATEGVMSWGMHDVKRNVYNPVNCVIVANASNADSCLAAHDIDILSNGFKLRNSSSGWINTSGIVFIYMAFAENPFVTSTGIPATAR